MREIEVVVCDDGTAAGIDIIHTHCMGFEAGFNRSRSQALEQIDRSAAFTSQSWARLTGFGSPPRQQAGKGLARRRGQGYDACVVSPQQSRQQQPTATAHDGRRPFTSYFARYWIENIEAHHQHAGRIWLIDRPSTPFYRGGREGLAGGCDRADAAVGYASGCLCLGHNLNHSTPPCCSRGGGRRWTASRGGGSSRRCCWRRRRRRRRGMPCRLGARTGLDSLSLCLTDSTYQQTPTSQTKTGPSATGNWRHGATPWPPCYGSSGASAPMIAWASTACPRSPRRLWRCSRFSSARVRGGSVHQGTFSPKKMHHRG